MSRSGSTCLWEAEPDPTEEVAGADRFRVAARRLFSTANTSPEKALEGKTEMSDHPYEQAPPPEPPPVAVPSNAAPPDMTQPPSPLGATSPPPLEMSLEALPSGTVPPLPTPPAPLMPQPPRRRRVSPGVIASVIVGAVFFFGSGFAVGVSIEDKGGVEEAAPASQGETAQDSPQSTPLKEARAACAPGSADLHLADGDYTLIIDRAGAELNPGANYLDVLCVLDELGAPDSVISRIEGTRALDGTQEADFGEYSAFWTYHPDDGLNMTITWNP